MKIELIQVDGFGKLVNYKWTPNAGVNVVYGSNEAGKSTLLNFIRAMFYGLNDRGRNELKADPRRRYLPWAGHANYGGSIVLFHKGIRYRLNRSFGQQKRFDKLQLLREESGSEVSLPKNTEPGEFLFSVREDEFVNTVFIAQMQSVMRESQDIQGKLMQLSSGTGPDISPVEMKQILKDKTKELQKNSANSRDRVLLARISEREEALAEAFSAEERRIKLRAEIAGIDATLKNYQDDLAAVRTALQCEDVLRSRQKLERIFVLREGLVKLDSRRNEARAAIDRDPLPSGGDITVAENLLREWSDIESALAVLQRQVEHAKSDLAAFEEEADLVAEQTALDALSARLQAAHKLNQELKEEEAQAKRDFEEVQNTHRLKLDEYKHAIESLEKDLELVHSKQESEAADLERRAMAVRNDKQAALNAHQSEIAGLVKELAGDEQRGIELKARVQEFDEHIDELKALAEAADKEATVLAERAGQAGLKAEAAREKLQHVPEQLPVAVKTAKAPLLLAGGILLALAILLLVLGSSTWKIIGAVLLLGAIVAAVAGFLAPRRLQTQIDASRQNRSEYENILAEQQDIQASALKQREETLTRRDAYLGQVNGNEQRKAAVLNAWSEVQTALAEKHATLAELESVNTSKLEAPYLEDERAAEDAIRKHREVYAEKEQRYKTRLAELNLDTEKLETFIDSLEYRVEDLLQEKIDSLNLERSEIALLLDERHISDSDSLRAARDRVAERLTRRNALMNRIDEIKRDYELSAGKRLAVKEAFAKHIGDLVKAESPGAAREGLDRLAEKLRTVAQLDREYEQMAKQEAETRGALTAEELPLKLAGIANWLDDHSEAASIFGEYGGEALKDQEAELLERERVAARNRGAAENALQSLEEHIVLPPDIEREIADLQAEYDEVLFQVEAINKAVELIEHSDEEVRQSFGPLIDAKTKAYLERLTGESSSQLKVSSSFGVNLATTDSILYEGDYYSDGKIDQIYLALRLAVGESIYDQDLNLPFFYDDILVQYDGVRSERTFDFLIAHSKEQDRQIFFITCHDHLCELARHKYGVPIHTLKA